MVTHCRECGKPERLMRGRRGGGLLQRRLGAGAGLFQVAGHAIKRPADTWIDPHRANSPRSQQGILQECKHEGPAAAVFAPSRGTRETRLAKN